MPDLPHHTPSSQLATAAAREVEFFRSAAELRAWFARHHGEKTELRVGYHKKGSGEASVTWPESVDEALCVGWIDGVRKGLDARRYMIRFTPRRRGSIWSVVNIRRVEALMKEGRLLPAGLKAFAARQEKRSGIYAYEQAPGKEAFGEPHEALFRQNAAAWTFFQAQRPSYRKRAGWWVVSAKQEATRLKRLEKLVAESAAGRMV